MKCSLLVLSSYLDGELEARRQGELEAHLVGCQRCRSGLGYLREEVERVSSLGRVSVADHSVHSLLSQLGLIEEEAVLPVRDHVAVAEVAPSWLEEPQPIWRDHPHMPSSRASLDENSVDMTGSPYGGAFWQPPEEAAGLPGAAVPPAPPPAAAAPPPDPVRQWPPPMPLQPDLAPTAPPSAGAFPPGGSEPSEPSDLPDHVTASGGDAEMTASPPWTPREAPPDTRYPLTDEDALDEPMPLERFGPPQQTRPSLFERMRDRIAVRRALSRSGGDEEDAVQIVSGSGAPLRTGHTRAEVGRRRQEALHASAAGIPGEAGAEASDPGDEVDLGPLPPTAPFVAPGATPPMPRPGMPPQMAIPGTDEHPSRQVMGTPLPRHDAPAPRVPMPPARHSLESAIGAPPPMSPAPLTPRPPAMPPSPPRPDPLAEALQEYELGRTREVEPRPWRPREIPEDLPPAAAETAAPGASLAGAPAVEPRTERAAAPDRGRRSPSQLRESRRLLALFGAATLVMLAVGLISGRTSTPLPSSSTTAQSSQPAPAQHPAASAKAPAPSGAASAPRASSAPAVPAAPPGTPQLTGAKVLGDGGSGYQVKDFRYGEHPNDFRIVLDLDAAGSASGSPKATIGFLDSTTLLVSIEGVVPAGSTGALPAGSPVSSITQLQPSPFSGAVTYQLKLSHAMTFSAGYVPGPLRLVLDLAG
jgi:Putative zinc-finger